MRYGSEFFPDKHKQTLLREEPSLARNYSTIVAATRIKHQNESHSTAKAACFHNDVKCRGVCFLTFLSIFMTKELVY